MKASANSTHGSGWRSTTEAEEGVGSGGGLSAWCVHLWVGCQLRGTEQGQEAQGGMRCLRKIQEHLGGGDLSWGRSASGWHQFPCGTGTQQWEKVSLAPSGLRPWGSWGPCGAWTTGTRRSEARCPCRCQAPYLPAPDTLACWFTRNARMRYGCSAGWVSGWPREEAEHKSFHDELALLSGSQCLTVWHKMGQL